MKRENKVWGERWMVHQDTTHTTNVLVLKSGTRCSWHKHRTKWNLFVVLEGRVGILTEDGEVTLERGGEFSVAPGVMHEFRVYESGSMVEVMYVEYDDDDIQRETPGGIFEEHRHEEEVSR